MRARCPLVRAEEVRQTGQCNSTCIQVDSVLPADRRRPVRRSPTIAQDPAGHLRRKPHENVGVESIEIAFGEPGKSASSRCFERSTGRRRRLPEKTEAMVRLALANSQMKDFLDIHRLAETRSFDGETLRLAIAATFAKGYRDPSSSRSRRGKRNCSRALKPRRCRSGCTRACPTFIARRSGTLCHALESEESRAGAADAIRALVEAIVREPDGDRLKITLKGDLGGDAKRGQRQ